LLNKAQAMEMASLPSKQQLLAQLVGTMKAPISGFHGVLHGLMGKFVRTLDAVRAKKA
jgi:large subunit ribosomal protein L10